MAKQEKNIDATDSPVVGEIRVSPISLPPQNHCALLRACLLLPEGAHELVTLIDLGADACIISGEAAQQLGLGRESLSCPVPARALSAHKLGMVTLMQDVGGLLESQEL